MLKSNPSYLGIAGKNPALGPPKSALGLRPWADFGGPRAGFFPEFLGQGLDFLPLSSEMRKHLADGKENLNLEVMRTFTSIPMDHSPSISHQTGCGAFIAFFAIFPSSAEVHKI